ncbi:esterase-like activity of phytase family protein [Maritalea mediterranea]|uniref:Esterase-like activity of phytase family protein n=1 Tax=Maritalea mediterranea TaxID=2909667 RepID=A0ABS9E9B0_9HYPH|nr:esterase-like activity of phytase family protein [Maritalea mediterranea]
MHRAAAKLLCHLALVCGVVAAGLLPAQAEPLRADIQVIDRFQGRILGDKIGKLIWRGGLVLRHDHEEFGGFSGITLTSEKGKFAAVTDRGHFLNGRLLYDPDGNLMDVDELALHPIKNSKGDDLPTKFSRDSESIETIFRDGVPSAVRVGFEHLTRVADFELENGWPQGAARDVGIPDWLRRNRHNGSLEALCIAPPTSPVAGSTLMLTENIKSEGGDHAAWLKGNKDRGELALMRDGGFRPTACAFLPNGDLVILKRNIGLTGFTMRLELIDGNQIKPGARLKGENILAAGGTAVDNMEGLAVSIGPTNLPRLTLMSDDNFNGWQRSMILQFDISY